MTHLRQVTEARTKIKENVEREPKLSLAQHHCLQCPYWSRFELFVCLLVLGGGGFAWTGQILKRSGSNLPDLNWFKVWPKKGPQGLMHSNSSQQPNQFSSCCRIKNRFKMFFRPIICMPKRIIIIKL